MQVIPVLDLRGGIAVLARAGRRHEYPPLVSPWVGGPDPATVITTIRSRFGLHTFYVADLDAIEETGSNLAAVAALAEDPRVTLMVDAGTSTVVGARRVMEAGGARVIIGSETLESLDALQELLRCLPATSLVFSLDVRNGQVLSRCEALRGEPPPQAARRLTGQGIRTLIVLELSRVGMGAGPDLRLLERVRDAAGDAALIAGGGIRGIDDLVALERLCFSGALVGTALSSGALKPEDLRRWKPASHERP